MPHPAPPTSFSALNQFVFERVLNEDPLTHSLIILGTFPTPDVDNQIRAIIRIEKTALNPGDSPFFFGDNGMIKKIQLEENTDIVRMWSTASWSQVDAVHPSTHGSLGGWGKIAKGMSKSM